MFCRVTKCNHLLRVDSSQPAHSYMAMKQMTAYQHREELLYSSKEAMRIIHVHKEEAVASLPEDPPVISTHGAQCYLSSLGSPDHVKHGFKSVAHKHQGPAAVLLVSCFFLLHFCVVLALIQLSQQERVWVSKVRHAERLLQLKKRLAACQLSLQQCKSKYTGSIKEI